MVDLDDCFVKKVYIRQYGFVGYGTRWDFTTWYYNLSGHKGLQISRTNGGQILLGTQCPDELQAFLAANSTLTTT